jgi:hypothetical protein
MIRNVSKCEFCYDFSSFLVAGQLDEKRVWLRRGGSGLDGSRNDRMRERERSDQGSSASNTFQDKEKRVISRKRLWRLRENDRTGLEFLIVQRSCARYLIARYSP